jgi:hypothetical protein
MQLASALDSIVMGWAEEFWRQRRVLLARRDTRAFSANGVVAHELLKRFFVR